MRPSRSRPAAESAPAPTAPYPHDRAVRVEVDSRPDGLVAIKSGTNPSGVVAVEREALILGQVHHPNVVELLRTERAAGVSTFVTTFAGRTTLATYQPPTPEAVARTGATLLTIVGELHEMGWIHGRIAADHVLIGDDGQLTLCAFGAAHRVIGTDPRIGVDVQAAVGLVASLARQLAEQRDRSGRKVQRQLDALLSGWQLEPSDPFRSTRSLRDRLSELAGEQTATERTGRFELGALPRRQPSRRPAARSTASSTARSTASSTAGSRRQPTKRTPPRWRAIGAAAGAIAGLLATIVAIRWLGGPPVNPFNVPTVTRLGDVPAPIAAALELIRIGAFLACLYGIAMAATALGAILTRNPELERVAIAMTPRVVRHAMVALIGLGLLAGAVGPEADAGDPTAVLATGTTVTTSTAIVPTTSTANIPTTSTTTSEPQPAATDQPAATEQPAATQQPAATEQPAALPNLWVIEPGDHLWKVSAETLARHLGRRPSSDEVHDYWVTVVELNRSSLLDPSNPDLIMNGQVIELPPLP